MTRGAGMPLIWFGGSVVDDEPTPVVTFCEYCVRRCARTVFVLVMLKMSMLGIKRSVPNVNALSTRKSPTNTFE